MIEIKNTCIVSHKAVGIRQITKMVDLYVEHMRNLPACIFLGHDVYRSMVEHFGKEMYASPGGPRGYTLTQVVQLYTQYGAVPVKSVDGNGFVLIGSERDYHDYDLTRHFEEQVLGSD